MNINYLDGQVNISASARLIFQLGEQLIPDELVALMELIKNAYDADATEINVDIYTNVSTPHGVGLIVLDDNGNGMTPSIIRNGFLRLSTTFKKENRITPYFKRRVLGDKGLGRLSFQRLGNYICVTTSPRIDRLGKLIKEDEKAVLQIYNRFTVGLDWNNFNMDTDFTEIKANVSNTYVEKPKLGCRIEVQGIKNQSFWDLKKKDEQRLKNEIFGMINPFFKQNNSKFQIYLKINDKPYNNDNIDEDVIKKISDVKVNFSMVDWALTIDIERKHKYHEREKNDKIKRMKESDFELFEENGSYSNLESSYIVDFKNSDCLTKFPFLSDFKIDTVDSERAYPGDFNGVIYASEFSRESQAQLLHLINLNEFPQNVKKYDELKAIWDSANGVFVFRNDFRILPYGKDEWMGFTNKSQTYKNNIFKAHSISGYIDIDSQTSENLVEQTNRLGIIEDEYGKNFFRLLEDVLVEIIVKDDVKFRQGFDDAKSKDEEFLITKNKVLKFKKVKSDERKKEEVFNEVRDTVKKAEENLEEAETSGSSEDLLLQMLKQYFNSDDEIKTIFHSDNQSIKVMLTAIRDSLNKGLEIKNSLANLKVKIDELKQIDEKVKNKNTQLSYIKNKEIEELQGLLPLVGQGIIVESLTHELYRIEENVRSYANKTKLSLEMKSLSDLKTLVENQKLIIDETEYLREQLNHLEPTYRKNRNLFEVISVKNFFKDTYMSNGPMGLKAKEKSVQVNVKGSDFKIEVNKGYLITVFDNLFLNSLYWVDFSNNKKEISFEIFDDGRINYWDSGPGIHEDIEIELFEPFKTMKKDGRGLGLYIAKELLIAMDAEIFMSSERRNNRLFKFQISFNKSWR